MDGIDMLRLVNITLSSGLLVACFMRLTRDWPAWSRREKVVRFHLCAYLFVIAYGTTEQLAHDTRPGWRILLTLAVNLSLAVCMWLNRKDPVR